MTLFRSMGAALEDDETGTNPIDVRKDLAGLFSGAGVVGGSTSPLVTGSAGWAYTIKAGRWVTSRGASDGVHLWGNDGDITVGSGGVGTTVTAAPGVGLSRIDIIYVLHPSNGENADTSSQPVASVAVGTAASSPIAPSIPVGALELARNTMTSSATTTSSAGNTIAQTAPRAALRAELATDPAKIARGSDTTHGPATWGASASLTTYPLVAGRWYLIHATGSVSIGGAAAEVLHRVRAFGVETSAQWPVTAAINTKYNLSGHLLFQAPSTTSVGIAHEVYVPSPATGIVVYTGNTVSIMQVG